LVTRLNSEQAVLGVGWFYRDIYAEVDGPVRMAMGHLWSSGARPPCGVEAQGLGGGKRIIGLYGDGVSGDWLTSTIKGAMGGPIDDPRPPVLLRYDDDADYSWINSDRWIVQSTSGVVIDAFSWDLSKKLRVASASHDPDGISPHKLAAIGDAVFFETYTDALQGLNVWDPAHGARPFIRWPGDPQRGASIFGTDGTDMAWVYAEGRVGNTAEWAKLSVMTAKYTTDPAQVAATARRLRSYGDTYMQIGSMAVGCGYAATFGGSPGHAWGDVLLVRLSDGWSWTIPASQKLWFDHPIGVTCKEVFILANRASGQRNVVRVAIDSLGPGQAPD
jgi:hypothetical protein